MLAVAAGGHDRIERGGGGDVGRVEELAGAGAGAAEAGDPGHGPVGRGGVVDVGSPDVAAQIAGVKAVGITVAIAIEQGDVGRDRIGHGGNRRGTAALACGPNRAAVDGVQHHDRAPHGIGSGYRIGVLGGVIATTHDDHGNGIAAEVRVALDQGQLGLRPGLAELGNVGVRLAPQEGRWLGWIAHVERVDQAAATARREVDVGLRAAGDAQVLVDRGGAVEEVVLAATGGSQRERGAVAAQALELAEKVRSDERPQLAAGAHQAAASHRDDAGGSRILVAVDGTEYAVVGTVEHHDADGATDHRQRPRAEGDLAEQPPDLPAVAQDRRRYRGEDADVEADLVAQPAE